MSKKITISILILVLILVGILAANKSASQNNDQNSKIPKSQNSKTPKSQNSNLAESDQNAQNLKNAEIEENIEYPISPISGIASLNGDRRPVAVMLAADEGTRPISGIGQADLVVEMPVIKNGINRFMAVFVTEDPDEIGSVRSARHDFIPLARGLDAIYAHWGGSHFALDKLNARIMDNIDALINPHSAFYRKSGIPKPDDGFTSISNLLNSAEKLGCEIKNTREASNIISNGEWNPEAGGWNYNSSDIIVNYPGKFGVEWKFNQEDKLYYRWRGGTSEIDKNTGEQVSAKVVALLGAESRHLEGQYNDVDIEGSGPLKIYQNGFYIEGEWSKDKSEQDSPMKFLDKNGYEIQLLAGQRWWEIYDK